MADSFNLELAESYKDASDMEQMEQGQKRRHRRHRASMHKRLAYRRYLERLIALLDREGMALEPGSLSPEILGLPVPLYLSRNPQLRQVLTRRLQVHLLCRRCGITQEDDSEDPPVAQFLGLVSEVSAWGSEERPWQEQPLKLGAWWLESI